jgi:hypothetical protein
MTVECIVVPSEIIDPCIMHADSTWRKNDSIRNRSEDSCEEKLTLFFHEKKSENHLITRH